MKKITGIVILAAFFAAMLTSPVTHAASGISVGFTVIPTKIVSAKSKVELRAGIKNNESSSKTVTVEFLVENSVVKTNTETVAAGGYRLCTFWWSAAGNSGCKVLGIRVKQSSAVVGEEYRVITVLDIGTVGPKLPTIAWEEPGAYAGAYTSLRKINQQDVVNQVEDMYSLGIDTIIYTYTEGVYYNTGAYYDSDLPELLNVQNPHPLGFDGLDTVLKAAEARGMNVIVGTGRGRDLFTPTPGNGISAFNKAVDFATKVMNEIWQKYGHYKSFYGWYISHEPSYLFSSGNGELIYVNTLIAPLRNKWPDKPVLIAPSGTPTIVVDDMKNSQADIFAFQDAVGPGYIPGQYTYNPENRIAMLDTEFKKYKTAMDKVGKHLWSDTENWQMDGPTYQNAYPALWSRVERQLDIEKKYVSQHSLYAYTGFMSSPDSTVRIGGEKAVNQYNEYAKFAKAYMAEHKIHNHRVKTTKVNITVTDIENVSSLIPKTIEVKLADCGKTIKVPVKWGTPSISAATATVTGTITAPGLKTAAITAAVTKGSSNRQVVENPSGSAGTSGPSSPAGSVSSQKGPSGETSSDILSSSSSADESQGEDSGESRAVSGESEAGTDEKTANDKSYDLLWVYILAGAAALAAIGTATFLKLRKDRRNRQ